MALQREVFTSRASTIITMIGVSVGLGNVWRFPYMMGKYGGSAFLFVYIAFTLLFAIPAMMAEMALGRATRQGPLGAFQQVFGPMGGKLVGYLLILTVIVADSYYLAVIANVVYTGYFSLAHGFTQDSLAAFNSGLANGWLQYAIALLILAASLVVLYRGLRQGIEAVSKFFVPFFGLVVIYLVVSAFRLPGAPQYFVDFLRPDFAALSIEHVFAALGQAFFSLGLGGTFLLIYGSYLKENENVPKSAFLTGLGDAGAALMASLFIIPSILVFKLDMTVGPSLIFSTLPKLFSIMPGGRLLGSLFLISLFMVAFLSNIAALEVAIGTINDTRKKEWKRTHIILVVGLVEMLFILPSSLHPALIGVLDLVFGSGMQVFGSALAVVGVVWGLGKQKALLEIFANSSWKSHELYFFWMRWVVPGALFYVLVSYIYASV